MRAMSAVSRAASVPAAPMATPRDAAASAGASFTPSPTMATAPARSRSSATASTFCAGRSPARTSVTPACAATARAVSGLSPVSMAISVTPRARSSAIAFPRPGTQGVADGDDAERAVLVADDHGRLALAFEPFDDGHQRRIGAVGAEEVGPAHEVHPAVQFCARTPRPGMARKRSTSGPCAA